MVLSLGGPKLADEVQVAGLSVGSLRAWCEGRRNGSVNEVLVVESQGSRTHVKARQDQEQPAIPVLGTQKQVFYRVIWLPRLDRTG